MSSIYAENIVDHYRFPRNFGKLENAQLKARELNPLCGDEIEFNINLDQNKRVSEVKFDGKGCAICLAASSMLTEKIKGKKLEEVHELTDKDVLELLNIELSPNRKKCALLSLWVLKSAIEKFDNLS